MFMLVVFMLLIEQEVLKKVAEVLTTLADETPTNV